MRAFQLARPAYSLLSTVSRSSRTRVVAMVGGGAAARPCLLRQPAPGAQRPSTAPAPLAPASQATSATPPTKYAILTYRYVPDILEKRGPYREGHLAGAKAKVCSLKPRRRCSMAGDAAACASMYQHVPARASM